jgi:hypothetical protein
VGVQVPPSALKNRFSAVFGLNPRSNRVDMPAIL